METKPPLGNEVSKFGNLRFPISHNSSVGYNIHHFEWCTKYRYRMFRREKYKKICEEAIIVMAERHDIQIRELSVMPEHVHVSAELPPNMSQSEALQILKGGTSYIIFGKIGNIVSKLENYIFKTTRIQIEISEG